MADSLIVLDRTAALRRAKVLNRLTIGWNLVEGIVAVWAGWLAGSVSLIGFGLDSGIEVSAALILAWRLAKDRAGECSQEADRRAQRLVAISFGVLAAYVSYEAVADLVAGNQPDVSIVGIVLAALSLAVMPVLARAKARLAPVLGSRAAQAEASQTDVCAWLSAAVLIGLGANAAFGWWWADPLAALVIAGIAAWMATVTWKADSLEDTCCG
ncbi:MAG: cation transporter [bacterium]|nr:cation transporter [bacterium]MCP4964632.1 cation transporter [bacterium]